jgi:predicted HD phosphohydrolase
LPTLQEQFQGEKHVRSFFRRPRHRPDKREDFGTWYSREHLPDAMKSFGAVKAWRYWSATDPSLHHAMYQFADKTRSSQSEAGSHRCAMQ